MAFFLVFKPLPSGDMDTRDLIEAVFNYTRSA
jgi:hypothetical protein